MKAFKAFINPFEAPQRNVKIRIQLDFFSSSGIGTGRVKVFVNVHNSKTRLEVNHVPSIIRGKGSFFLSMMILQNVWF